MRERRLVVFVAGTLGCLVLVLSQRVYSLEESVRKASFDEITVRRLNVIDEEGRVRVTLAGGYPPRRAHFAGLLFHRPDGSEAGGLVYYGERDAEGEIQAGALLTFDQFREDEIMNLSYGHSGKRKRTGLHIADRPDEMSEKVLAFYRAMESATSEGERAKIRAELLPQIPREELPASRLYAGRDADGASILRLSDPQGRPRLRLEVSESGEASISFLNEDGTVSKRVTP